MIGSMIGNAVIDWLDRTFNEIEKFIANHSDNPLLWIMILVMVLLIVAMASQALSKNR